VVDLVANLRSAPLGVSDRVRISLAGVQEKLLLTRLPDGSWGRPVDGTPSTHILKPEVAAYPKTVENEAFCMRLAQHLGLEVANIDTTEVGGRKLIVVERYDRTVHPDGLVERIHQEDFCQATGLAPATKYEEDGGPSLLRIAQIVDAVARRGSLDRLLRAVTLNAIIGNGDAHGKNFSLLHEAGGALTLAPVYDVMSTKYYGDDRLAMDVDHVHRTSRVTMEHIVNEAGRWGMSRDRATSIIADVVDKAPAAIAATRDETPDVPADLVDAIEQQLQHVRSTA
jgi:serine/threonine-protein kinase HipA